LSGIATLAATGHNYATAEFIHWEVEGRVRQQRL